MPQARGHSGQQRLLKRGECRWLRRVERHGPRGHLPGAEERFSSLRVFDVALEPPHHVLAIALRP
ncbi:MAG: hypothetical protein ACK559_03505, partial [bacterium]